MSTIVYDAFDILHIDGAYVTGEPLLKRRERLHQVLHRYGLLLSKPLPGSPQAIMEAVHGLELEGVIAKRKLSLCVPGERSDWQKMKLQKPAAIRDRRLSSWID